MPQIFDAFVRFVSYVRMYEFFQKELIAQQLFIKNEIFKYSFIQIRQEGFLRKASNPVQYFDFF